jgi:hypothetical protein
MGGPSAAEQQLQQEQAQATAQYMTEQSQTYAESQSLYQTMLPMLEQEMNNPTGFSSQELADLNASNVNTTGAQYANVQKQVNLANASNNMAGLTSGVQAGETAALQGAAAGTVATNAQNTQLASTELAQQKQQTAQSELLALQSGQGGEAINMGQVENQSENNAFQQASTMQQQSNQLGMSILGGVMGAGQSLIGAAGQAGGFGMLF